MRIYGYDGATQPDLAQVSARGGKVVAYYLTARYAVGTGRHAAILAAGAGPLPNYEEDAAELTAGGAARGEAAAFRAIAAAQRQGLPQGHSIFYSVDTYVSPANYPAVGAVFAGINAAHAGRYCVHLYGQGGLIDYLKTLGLICSGTHWLSESTGYPGYNAASPNVGLVQMYNDTDIAGTDRNYLTNAAGLHLQWPAGAEGITSLGGGVPVGSIAGSIGGTAVVPTFGGFDMASQADKNDMAVVVNDAVLNLFRAPEIANIIAAAVVGAPMTDADGKVTPEGLVIREIQINARAAAAKSIDLNALAIAIASKLPAGSSSLTADQIKAASEDALRDVLGSLDGKV